MAMIRREEEDKLVVDQLVFWNVKTGENLKVLKVTPISSIAFSPTGQEMAIEFADTPQRESSELLVVYSLDHWNVLGKCGITPTGFDPKDDPSIGFRPGSDEIAVANPHSQTLELWDWRKGALRQSLDDYSGNEAFAWTPDGTRLVAIRQENDSGDAVLMNCNPDRDEWLFELGTQSFVKPGHSLRCVPGTNKLFSWSNRSLQYWDGTPEHIDNE